MAARQLREFGFDVTIYEARVSYTQNLEKEIKNKFFFFLKKYF
jgi:hypothetical protein